MKFDNLNASLLHKSILLKKKSYCTPYLNGNVDLMVYKYKYSMYISHFMW